MTQRRSATLLAAVVVLLSIAFTALTLVDASSPASGIHRLF